MTFSLLAEGHNFCRTGLKILPPLKERLALLSPGDMVPHHVHWPPSWAGFRERQLSFARVALPDVLFPFRFADSTFLFVFEPFGIRRSHVRIYGRAIFIQIHRPCWQGSHPACSWGEFHRDRTHFFDWTVFRKLASYLVRIPIV